MSFWQNIETVRHNWCIFDDSLKNLRLTLISLQLRMNASSIKNFVVKLYRIEVTESL